MLTAATLAMTFLVLAMILVEAQQRPRHWYGALKIVASLLFVITGVVVVDDVPGVPGARPLFLAALLLSFVGDVALVPRGHKRIFQVGLVSFLLAHIVFIPAFAVRGIDVVATAIVGAVMLLPLIAVLRWLKRHVKGSMWGAVAAYVVVISVMFSVAIGSVVAGTTSNVGVTPMLAIGALSFWLSDVTVARERFIAHSFINRLLGIPLYFFAQLALIAGYQLH
ncbi:MAG TPA: lysoplasmalogenase family protein [Myxococcota bacterium]